MGGRSQIAMQIIGEIGGAFLLIFWKEANGESHSREVFCVGAALAET